MSDMTKSMLNRLEDLPLGEQDAAGSDDGEDLPDESVIGEYTNQQLGQWRFNDFLGIFPLKLLSVCLLTAGFVLEYYVRRCVRTSEGQLVSRDMHLPKSAHFSLL